MEKVNEDRIKNDERFNSVVRYSHIPMRTYQTHRLYNFLDLPGAETAHKAALAFISGELPHHFLTFNGKPGRGKTHLAFGIGWHWMENGMGLVLYFQVETLLDDLRSGYHARDGEEFYNFDQKMKRVKEVDLLILDDLGVEQSTEWARAKLDEIVDHRYINGYKTIFTTNLHPDKLEPRIASRLKEGVVAVLKSRDYRPTKAKVREV